ncbi:hypothetical protein LguiA_005332 [Lonicera macranthoides]
MVCTVACAAVCARHLAKRRPRMSEIVTSRHRHLGTGQDDTWPTRPLRTPRTLNIFNYDTAQYKEDLKKFIKMALEGNDHNNSSESHHVDYFEAESQDDVFSELSFSPFCSTINDYIRYIVWFIASHKRKKRDPANTGQKSNTPVKLESRRCPHLPRQIVPAFLSRRISPATISHCISPGTRPRLIRRTFCLNH